MKRRRLIALAAILILVALSLSPAAREERGKDVAIIGEVIDIACYLDEGERGEDHKGCGIACAKGGQDLGILESNSGWIYGSIALNPGDDPNAKLMDYVAEVVKVKGKLFDRGGVRGIKVASVEKTK